MDILAALKSEEAKFEKQMNSARQQLDTIRATIKAWVGVNGSGKATGGKRRVMSAAARARISKAQKARWAKVRAAKTK